MTTAKQVAQFLDGLAPFDTAMDFDNVGLLVGDPDSPVDTALLSLDITGAVVQEAAALGAQLIISHHPVIFHPLKRLSPRDIPAQLIQQNLTAICAHTNLDLAPCGVNACLAAALGLSGCTAFQYWKNTDLAEGLMGTLETPLPPQEFAVMVKERLHCRGVKYTPGSRVIRTVGVACGAGSGLLFAAAGSGVDAFVTGESKHHEWLAAQEMGVTMVDAGHFNTEDVVILPLLERLQAAFPAVKFQKSKQADPVWYLT